MIRDKKITEQSYYRHFKDKWYKVSALAEHTETGETIVIYQALYGSKKTYARPYAMFVSKVDVDKYPNAKQEYRFEHIEDTEVSLEEFSKTNK